MRILDDAELLRRETVWLREIALKSRWNIDALPLLDDDARRTIRMALLYAWIRYRYPIGLQFVTNYVAVIATAVGMTAACAAAGLIAASFAAGSGSSSAPWWLFPLAPFAAASASSIIAGWADVRWMASLIRREGPRGIIRRIASVGRLGQWFPIGVICAVITVAAVASWLTVSAALTAPAGQQLVITAAALFGAALGLGTVRWIRAVQELLRARYRRSYRPRPLDGVFVELASTAAACHLLRPIWASPRTIKTIRRRLGFATDAAGDTTAIRHRTSFSEFAVRRKARRFHTALAELIRRHDRAITQVRTADEYEAITASLSTGVVALALGDLTTLMQHSAPEPPVSRATRFLRRTGSSLVLTLFAVVIPLLPGVESSTGQGVRVLLLMTAALSLTPVSDLASGSIRSALERSLLTKGTD